MEKEKIGKVEKSTEEKVIDALEQMKAAYYAICELASLILQGFILSNFGMCSAVPGSSGGPVVSLPQTQCGPRVLLVVLCPVIKWR